MRDLLELISDHPRAALLGQLAIFLAAFTLLVLLRLQVIRWSFAWYAALVADVALWPVAVFGIYALMVIAGPRMVPDGDTIQSRLPDDRVRKLASEDWRLYTALWSNNPSQASPKKGVLFATTRKIDQSLGKVEANQIGFNRSTELKFGGAEVRIPQRHKIGHVEARPSDTVIFGVTFFSAGPQEEYFHLGNLELS
jgi:hypothetical protein